MSQNRAFLSLGFGKDLVAEDGSGLASATGMDPKILTATIAQYNENCKSGLDRDFGKAPQFMRAYADKGSVYPVLSKNSVGKTVGAIQTNRDFSVVTEAAKAIKGLYSVGTEGATIWANIYTMNLSGSCAAHNVYSGRTAAKHAANLV